MKNNRVLKTVTLILIILLICLVSFVGVYVKKLNYMENVVKEYNLGSNLEGVRLVRLFLNTESEEVVVDSEGNEVEDADSLTDDELKEKGYTKKSVPVNSDEVKIAENYREARDIVDKRLKDMGATDYVVKVDETSGDITIELEENESVDNILGYLNQPGKFQIVNEDADILMDNSYIKEAKVMYSSQSTGTAVYLNIEFNKEGKKKLEEISNEYVKSTDADGNETEKKVTLKIDEQDMIETSFDEPLTSGTIQLSIGSTTTDSAKIEEYVKETSGMVSLLNNGEMKVNYQIGENKFIYSDITPEILKNVIIVVLAIILIGLVVFVVKYRFTGLIAGISYIGMLAALLLIVRYTNVVLTIEGLVAVAVILAINYLLNFAVLARIKKYNSEKMEEVNIENAFKDAGLEFALKIVPVLIVAIAFCFTRWVPLTSFGMVMFWGLVVMVIYNILITRTLLIARAKN